jgi:hypothetical protein
MSYFKSMSNAKISKIPGSCLRKVFTHFVIPDLIRNPVLYPVFPIRIPAGVYPDGNRGGNDVSQIIVKPLLRHHTS